MGTIPTGASAPERADMVRQLDAAVAVLRRIARRAYQSGDHARWDEAAALARRLEAVREAIVQEGAP